MTVPEKAAIAATRKPHDAEIEVFGLTHAGNVRTSNQDHFLIASLYKHMRVHQSSLPAAESVVKGERIAMLAVVADGVGGGPRGEEASRLTLETVTRYVARSLHCYYTGDATDERAFPRSLEEAALRCHLDLERRALDDPELRGMATTLTLWLGVWPSAYLLQVGDSRFYRLRHGVLQQVSRDQTVAQDLLDQGVFTRTDAMSTRWANVLASAIGGPDAAPVVTTLDQMWGDIGLLCSDGLTKHVSDERIHERLSTMSSARQACEALLQDALSAGGRDNITVLVGRSVRRDAG